jgi:hypothetical protein
MYVFVQGDLTYILAMYVDDTFLTSPIGDFITRIKDAFGSKFDVQDYWVLYRGNSAPPWFVTVELASSHWDNDNTF